MASTYRILNFISIFFLVFLLDGDPKPESNLSNSIEASLMDNFEPIMLKEKIKIGVKKQSLLRLEYTTDEQREF